MKQSTFLNNLNWCCVECMCFRISYSGSASSNASKAVSSLYCNAHEELFCIQIFSFMARGPSL